MQKYEKPQTIMVATRKPKKVNLQRIFPTRQFAQKYWFKEEHHTDHLIAEEPITSPILKETGSLLMAEEPIASMPLNNTDSLSGLHIYWMSKRSQRLFLSLSFFAIGFSAITALAIAIIGWVSLDIAAYIMVWPAVVLWIFIGIMYPSYGKLALKGFVIGVIACFYYDCMRFVFIELGIWGDFIPKIGMWLLHTNKPDVLVGYLWRYIGDGGFMGMAFTVSYRALNVLINVRIAALAFGLAIWLCLIATILIAPHGSEMLFALTWVTLILSLFGHIIYGVLIGLFYPVFINRKGIELPLSNSPLSRRLQFGRSL